MIYLFLIKEFFIISILSVGGGLVALPFIQNIANTTNLINQAQIIEMVTISEITPGPILVNMATYVGYILKGIPGAIITTTALVLPQIFIIFTIYKILNRFKESKNVEIFLKGLRPISLALFLGGTISIFYKLFIDTSIKIKGLIDVIRALNIKYIVFGIIVLIIMRKNKKIHPFIFILFGGLVGIFL